MLIRPEPVVRRAARKRAQLIAKSAERLLDNEA